MTLIVGRLWENQYFIEADSRISDPTRVRTAPLCGQLKCVIVTPFVCVCFAGVVEYATRALSQILKLSEATSERMLDVLKTVHEESGGATDFALVALHDGTPRATKLSDGVAEETDHFWLGDVNAFSAFQEAFHECEGLEMNVRMNRAFRSVVDDERHPSVGDFHIRTAIDRDICPGESVFLHGLQAEFVISHPQTLTFEKGQQSQAVPLGSVEGGAYGVSYLRTVSPEHHGVAIHFPHARFGAMWIPQVSLEPVIIKDVDGPDFVQRVLADYGVPLQGMVRASATALQFLDTRFSASRRLT